MGEDSRLRGAKEEGRWDLKQIVKIKKLEYKKRCLEKKNVFFFNVDDYSALKLPSSTGWAMQRTLQSGSHPLEYHTVQLFPFSCADQRYPSRPPTSCLEVEVASALVLVLVLVGVVWPSENVPALIVGDEVPSLHRRRSNTH